LQLIIAYIQRQNEVSELTSWTVAVRGREIADPVLGDIELGLGKRIPMISRTRLISDPDSLGIITNPGDEQIGLTDEQLAQVKEKTEAGGQSINPTARSVREATEGLLLLYPVSRFSGHEKAPRQSRMKLYENPSDPGSKDVICFAISFPQSSKEQGIKGEYVIGTVDWRPV
jgi:hypothetical protein